MIPMKLPPSLSRVLAGVAAAAAVGGAGCLMQASYAVNVTTADGVQIEVPLTLARLDISDGAISVKNFAFTPWAMGNEKGLAFGFQLEFKAGSKPVAITVDDVSDTPILSVYSDNAPILSKKSVWSGMSPAHHPTEDLVRWILTLDNSVKVYRFTVKLADGTTHVLRYPVFAPAQMKTFMRGQLGVS